MISIKDIDGKALRLLDSYMRVIHRAARPSPVSLEYVDANGQVIFTVQQTEESIRWIGE